MLQMDRPADYPWAECADAGPIAQSRVVCVGQPGARANERLEAMVGKILAHSKHPLDPQVVVGGVVHNCPIYLGSSGYAAVLEDST